MIKAIYSYDPNRVYAPSECAKHIDKLTLKANGKVDFDNPPKGYAFAAQRLDGGWEEANRSNLDPRFIEMHNFGAYYALAYRELTSPEVADYMKRMYEKEDLDLIRHRRCLISSESTGKPVLCPYDGKHNCSTCERPEKDRGPLVISYESLSRTDPTTGELIQFDLPDKTQDTEGTATAHVTAENIMKGLEDLDSLHKKKHYHARQVEAFIKITEEGYESADLECEFKMSKSTVSNMVARIRKEAEKNGFRNPNK